MNLKWYHYVIYNLRLRIILGKIQRASGRLLKRQKREPVRLEGWSFKLYAPTYMTVILQEVKSDAVLSMRASKE